MLADHLLVLLELALSLFDVEQSESVEHLEFAVLA